VSVYYLPAANAAQRCATVHMERCATVHTCTCVCVCRADVDMYVCVVSRDSPYATVSFYYGCRNFPYSFMEARARNSILDFETLFSDFQELLNGSGLKVPAKNRQN